MRIPIRGVMSNSINQMENKSVLGKGLSAIFSEKNVDLKIVEENFRSGALEIEVGKIRHNLPNNLLNDITGHQSESCLKLFFSQ